MTYSAKIKLIYINDTPPKYNKHFPDIVDEHTITIEAPAQDLNIHQYFALFKSFLRAIDFSEYSIMDGACGVAFSDSNKEEDMKKLMEEYELQDKQAYTDDDARALEAEIRDLKAKLSRLENPDNPNYTDEEMEALCSQNKISSDILKDAQIVCKDCGIKYGSYSVGCSSIWVGICDVCGQKKSVTETRDWNYLKEGISRLDK